jgi:NAD(P)-dependent dehydrogenase (short-subunit alcohol dehydrogenase family)
MAAKDQQVALVVGASRGIGRQVAVDLAKNGYTGMSQPSLLFKERAIANNEQW